MPLAGTPPPNKRKKSSKLITDLAHITQEVDTSEQTRSEFDLGRKVGTPKDIMLEELSLLKNKGSQMFKMRQLRVNRFIYENNPDVFIPDSNDYHQKFVPGMGGKVDVGGHLVSGRMVGYAGFVAGGQAPPPPPKPGSHHAGVGVGVSGGQGHGGGPGGGKGQGHGQQHGGSALDGGAHHGGGVAGADHGAGGGPGKTKTDVMSMYTSPWERAMKGNEDLVATLKPHMPGPEAPHELRKYKSFNRTAMPYGGVERALQLMRFQLPERKTKDLEPVIVYPHDISQRPSFNRTPIGWISSGEPSHIHVEMETVETVPFDGETDEL